MTTNTAPDPARLAEIVRKFPDARVLVVGDVVADQFVYGEISRVSREAPVMILRYETTQTLPGGAGNAASNAAALDATVALVGVVGRDRAGRSTLLELRRRGVDTTGVVGVGGHTTPTKTRILAGSVHSLRQQVIRIDNEPALAMAEETVERLAARARAAVSAADVVIVSDYNYGAARPEVVDVVREECRSRGVPILVDSRFRLAEFAHVTSATPNESELEGLVGAPLLTETAVAEAGRRIAEGLDLDALLVTRGGKGMLLFERGAAPHPIRAVGGREAIDVTGAGDTVIATYALGLASGASFAESAHLANHAGSLVVMKRGTATVGREELLASVLDWLPAGGAGA